MVLCDGRKYISLLQNLERPRWKEKEEERGKDEKGEKSAGNVSRRRINREYMYIVSSRQGENLRENWLDVDREKMY